MKILFYILIIIAISAAGFVAYLTLVQPPKEPILGINVSTATTTSSDQMDTSSKTKTYRNEEFGFEFQYPKEWAIRREDKSVNYYSKLLLMISAPVIFNNEQRFDPAFDVNITLPEFPERSFGGIDKTVSEITVDGVRGVKYEYEFENFPETAIILPFGEFKMILGTGGGNRQYLDELNQILASFKFLK